MESLFDAPPASAPPLSHFETWRRADCLRHAAYWRDMANEQPKTERGRKFAAECTAAAQRMRDEANEPQPPFED